MNPMEIARVAYAANRAYCEAMGDTSQPPWNDAAQWQKDSVINGVDFHLMNPSAMPGDSHENWLEEKRLAGWTFGPVKDVSKKQHPCMLPYDELPVEQQAKDYIFRGVVKALIE